MKLNSQKKKIVYLKINRGYIFKVDKQNINKLE